MENMQVKIEKQIEKLKQNIKVSEIQIQTLEDVLKLHRKEEAISILKTYPGNGFKKDSIPEKVYQVLHEENRDMEINEILRAMGGNATQKRRNSLNVSISYYAGLGKYFTKPKTGYFGLIGESA